MKKKIRLFLSIFILILTIYEFIHYLQGHRSIVEQLAHLIPVLIVILIILYLIILLVLTLIMQASLTFFGFKISNFDNLLLNAYSIVVNFFMFGQIGPALRAVYLKKKFQLSIKKFIFITLIYYGIYSVLSVLLIIFGSKIKWYYGVLAVVLVLLISFLIIRWFFVKKLSKNWSVSWHLNGLIKLIIVTAIQLLLQTIIYGLELDSISPVSWHQIMAYSGFANLSLFVSITPAGIGIRETFLILSERIHHISSSQIVAASIIDRSVYLIFLLGVVIFLILFHAGKKIKKMSNVEVFDN